MLMEDYSLKCQDFKCFSETPHGFERIKPINVIIGRNNSGKTTLLDLVEYATVGTDISALGHKSWHPGAIVSWRLTRACFAKKLPDPMNFRIGNQRWNIKPAQWAVHHLDGKRAVCQMNAGGNLSLLGIDDFETEDPSRRVEFEGVVKALKEKFPNPFRHFVFRRVVSDRDIVQEPSGDSLFVEPNGRGVTNVIQRFLNDRRHDASLIEETLLQELNAIFRPDADFTRILARQAGATGMWEIFLEESGKGRVPLSQTGSGLKTVLLVLANLLLVPRIAEDSKPMSDYFFGFEELENNLHPAIQRRLFTYLRQKAIAEKCHFFITTHSNVVIDLFSGDENAQLLHVTHDGECSSVKTIETSAHGRDVLDDLGVRASDLLQTNAVVWVEGPSDVLYFNRWIELWSGDKLKEGIHYQCLPVGGSSHAHFSFESPECVNEMIRALKINGHAILLADSDKGGPNAPLDEHTQRLAKEVQDVGGYAWITAGREIENYIPASVLQEVLGDPSLSGPDQFADVLRFVADYRENKTSPKKVVFARQVIPLLTRESLASTLDMSEHLVRICGLIGEWNRV